MTTPLRWLAATVGVAGALFLAACVPSAPASTHASPPPTIAAVVPPAVRAADFGDAAASADARRLAGWVMASADHGERPFAIVDKREARVFVFAADGRLAGSAPVLVGATRGDDTVPGVGDKPIAQVLESEKTTPAGRFVTVPGVNAHGKPVVWIDYDAAVSMHAVVTEVASERRLQRLASADPREHRISFGCINLPAAFFETVARPAFATRGGIVYVLPETRPLETTFPGVAARRPAV